MLIYRENFTLSTHFYNFDLEQSGGWVPDRRVKQDYDPDFVQGSSRVYPDGDYICSVYIGGDEIITTGIMEAGDVETAKRACEDWMEEKAKVISLAVEKALKE